MIDPPVELDDPAARAEAERWIAALGYRAPGAASWYAIELAQAEDLLRGALAYELAYDACVLDDARARDIARTFLGWFSPPCVALTNAALAMELLPRASSHGPHFARHDWDVERQQPYPRPSALAPVMDSTFEAGVVVVSRGLIGMLWVMDED